VHSLGMPSAGWVYYEVVRRTTVPKPWFMNAFLFLHLIPISRRWGCVRHQTEGGQKFRLGTLDFLLLFVWWGIASMRSLFFHRNIISLNVGSIYQKLQVLYG